MKTKHSNPTPKRNWLQRLLDRGGKEAAYGESKHGRGKRRRKVGGARCVSLASDGVMLVGSTGEIHQAPEARAFAAPGAMIK